MLFNSIEFSIFLPVVFILYWALGRQQIKLQNLLLLGASYLFYGWWDWRFLSLIAFSSVLDFYIGRGLAVIENERKRKSLLTLSLLVNLGFLGFFKYFNFFTDSFANAFTWFGHPIDVTRLDIVLPVGISFYTFQTLSYSIDVYRRKLKPASDIVDFLTFVSFFPQLVAGPIERATNLLPQFSKERRFDEREASDGMRQILWGLFKKVIVADNCAIYVNDIFTNYGDYSGSTLLLGAVLFAFQIYGDFSGYSDIAIGVARLFGFKLTRNFAFPYFSRDIAEFWRRWHISLSTWFRDYLYIPLGGSKGGLSMKVRNTFAIFLVSGFWHGASWNFLVWGLLNALYFLPLLLLKQNRKNTNTVAEERWFPNVRECIQMGITFFITVIAWVFFRAENLTDAFLYLQGIFSESLWSKPEILPKKVLIFVAILLIIEWINRTKEHGLEFSENFPRSLRWFIYIIIWFAIILLDESDTYSFIYFQF